MLPFTSVMEGPKYMERSAVLTEDYIEQFGSARFVYKARPGVSPRFNHCTGNRIKWLYTRVKPETFHIYQEGD
jgi:hypothetical protein